MVDAIVCIAVFIHVEADELDTAFRNMANVLTKNRCVLISTKDGRDKKRFAEYNHVEYARNFLQYTKDDLRQYAEKYFKIIKEYPVDEEGWKTYFLSKI